jgi:hypothetical protein
MLIVFIMMLMMFIVLLLVFIMFMVFLSPLLSGWYYPYPYPYIVQHVRISLEVKGCWLAWLRQKNYTLVFFNPKNYVIFVHFDYDFFLHWRGLIICLYIFFYKNNLQIRNIAWNLKLLPYIVKGHFTSVFHLHVSINFGHFSCIMSSVKTRLYLWIIYECMCFLSHSAKLEII